jgi:hypothetical protein
MRDYSSNPARLASDPKAKPVPTVKMVVRPGCRYGEAVGGEEVIVDKDEMLRQPTAETLWTAKEHRQWEVDAPKRVRATVDRTPPIKHTIDAALAAIPPRVVKKKQE